MSARSAGRQTLPHGQRLDNASYSSLQTGTWPTRFGTGTRDCMDQSKRSPWRCGLALASACVGLLASACNPQTLPGTQLGTYNVTGALGANTCGSGLGAPSPWTFTVQMSEDTSTTPTTLYWLSSDGTELSSTMSS